MIQSACLLERDGAEKELGRVIISNKLSTDFIIPDLPYVYKFNGNHLFLGSVIGFFVLPFYFANPHRLSLRFTNYHKIKGLIDLFGSSSANTNKLSSQKGQYYFQFKKQGTDRSRQKSSG